MLLSCSNEESSIQTSLKWARMAPLPENSYNIEVTPSGSSFTQEFLVSFRATENEINAWLSKSPGIQDAEIVTRNNGVTYKVTPGGGAQFAEVKVNWDTLVVKIRAYWS